MPESQRFFWGASPFEYDVLVSNLETAQATDQLMWETVKTRLLQEEFRKKNSNGSLNSRKVSSNEDMVKATSAKQKKIICNFCKRPGLIKAKCFKWKKEKRASGSGSENTCFR